MTLTLAFLLPVTQSADVMSATLVAWKPPCGKTVPEEDIPAITAMATMTTRKPPAIHICIFRSFSIAVYYRRLSRSAKALRLLRFCYNGAMTNPILEAEKALHIEDVDRAFLLKVVQPSLVGLIDGSISTLAPLFAAAFASHSPH